MGALLDLLLPLRCPCCAAPAGGPCPACVRAFTPPPSLPVPIGLDELAAAYAYTGAVTHVVLATKRTGQHALTRFMADSIVALTAAPPPGIGVVSWVPTTAARRRTRGFDHGEELARRVARHAGLPCRSLLVRRSGARDHAGGGHAVAFDPAVDAARSLRGGVLLVDDVRTTGATLRAAASALRRAGASLVVARTFAATPAPGRES